jgi:glycerol-3-phosphate O-acyltransferase 1/2
MSGLGAFFIKRRMDPVTGRRDVVYRAILHTYIMECLRAGHNIEFFVEGGRSRTGKPCMPKSGILSVIVDAYMDGTIEDALLVPVSMNYERLVDGNFVREQLGMPKKMETFSSTIRAIWSTLRGNYGIVKIEICQPFSLKANFIIFLPCTSIYD